MFLKKTLIYSDIFSLSCIALGNVLYARVSLLSDGERKAWPSSKISCLVPRVFLRLQPGLPISSNTIKAFLEHWNFIYVNLIGNPVDLTELLELKETVQEQKEIGSISIKQLFTERTYYYPFGIAMSLMFMQQFSGVNVVIFYAQTIFRDAGSELDPGLQKIGLSKTCL